MKPMACYKSTSIRNLPHSGSQQIHTYAIITQQKTILCNLISDLIQLKSQLLATKVLYIYHFQQA